MERFLEVMIMLLKITGCGVLITLGLAMIPITIMCVAAVLGGSRKK